MTEQAAASGRSARSIVAQIAAVVGIVLCVALIVLVWLGRGSITGSLDGLSTDVNGAFDRAIAPAEAATGRLDQIVTSIDSISIDSTDLASATAPTRERLSALQARLSGLADRYRELRVNAAEVRENVASAISALRLVARIVPGDRVPPGVTDAVAAVEEKLTSIDEALSAAVESVQENAPVETAAEAISERTSRLQTAVAGASDSVSGLSSRLTTAKAKAGQAIGGVQTIVTVGTVAISLIILWVLVLNVALWELGRRWRRDDAAHEPSATTS
ncbi:MAG: hypothetical protein ACJ767_09410 [Chloroflexota bacterium]